MTFLFTEKECDHGAVNLVGGVTNSTGRLEFCAHGKWGRVCNFLGYWDHDNARVVATNWASLKMVEVTKSLVNK